MRRAPVGWLFLLLRAYRNWDFPKGVVDPGEEPLAAARREVKEETLIEDLQFTWGEEYYDTEPYSNNKVARYYIAETRTEQVTLPVSPELGRPEHNESRWWDLSGALGVASPRVTLVVNWAVTRMGIVTGTQ